MVYLKKKNQVFLKVEHKLKLLNSTQKYQHIILVKFVCNCNIIC